MNIFYFNERVALQEVASTVVELWISLILSLEDGVKMNAIMRFSIWEKEFWSWENNIVYLFYIYFYVILSSQRQQQKK